jgi:hypothetical protein
MAIDGDLIVAVGGAALTGWERIELEFSVERYPRHCMIRMSERDPRKLTDVVAQFAPCTVMIGSDLIITGYVDIIEPRYDKAGHWITLMICGKCEDLADCSVDVDALAGRYRSLGDQERYRRLGCAPVDGGLQCQGRRQRRGCRPRSGVPNRGASRSDGGTDPRGARSESRSV